MVYNETNLEFSLHVNINDAFLKNPYDHIKCVRKYLQYIYIIILNGEPLSSLPMG